MTKTPDLFSSGNSWSGIYLIPTLLLGWKTVEKETAWMMTFCPEQSQARLYTKRPQKETRRSGEACGVVNFLPFPTFPLDGKLYEILQIWLVDIFSLKVSLQT